MNDCLFPYILHHKACTAEAESNEIPATDDDWSITHLFSLHATNTQHYSALRTYGLFIH